MRHKAEMGQTGLRWAREAGGTNGLLWRRGLETGQHRHGCGGWRQVEAGRNKGRRQGRGKGQIETGRGGEEGCRVGWLGSGGMTKEQKGTTSWKLGQEIG